MNSLRGSPWPTSCGTAAQRKSKGVLRKQHAFCICVVSNFSLWGCPHRQFVPGAVVIVTRSLGSVTLLQQLDLCNRLPHYHVIANQPAGWCGNPFSCNAWHCVGKGRHKLPDKLQFTDQFCFRFSKWPDRITGGFGSFASQGMGFFSSSFTKIPPFRGYYARRRFRL